MYRMKKMEKQIAITFAIMFVVGFIINGLYSVISMDSNFFTFGVASNAILFAFIYLFYIWLYTRQHKLLTIIGVCCIGLMLLFINFSSKGFAASFSSWDWRDTVTIICYFIASFIADYQSQKLIEESKEPINIKVIIKGNIEPENIDVSIDD